MDIDWICATTAPSISKGVPRQGLPSAQRESFLLLYPQQHRLANGQGCWNGFDTGTGRAYGEAALIMKT